MVQIAFVSSRHEVVVARLCSRALTSRELPKLAIKFSSSSFQPGPLGLPGLGNLFQINKSIPALTYSTWAHKYGQGKPLGVKLGATNIVVLNSARMVRHLFERRGAIYSDRPRPNGEDEKWKFQTHQVPASLFHDSGPWLTRWRREFNGALGSAAAVARLHPPSRACTR